MCASPSLARRSRLPDAAGDLGRRVTIAAGDLTDTEATMRQHPRSALTWSGATGTGWKSHSGAASRRRQSYRFLGFLGSREAA